MNASIFAAAAHIAAWLVVAAAMLAVWLGYHWTWVAAAVAVAVAADARDAVLRARRASLRHCR